ncbi:hypothetical protein BH09PSE4_BH09PSE4_17900 [soil metagenome]
MIGLGLSLAEMAIARRPVLIDDLGMYDASAAGKYGIGYRSVTRLDAGGWNGNAYSTLVFQGGASMVFQFTGGQAMAGLSDGREYTGGGSEYDKLDFGVYFNGASWTAYESGSPNALTGDFSLNSQWRIAYDNAFVRYFARKPGEGEVLARISNETLGNRIFAAAVAINTSGVSVSNIALTAS